MRKIILVMENLPQWYGLGVVFLYSLLLADFFSTFMHLFPYKEVLSSVFTVILGVGYVVSILSAFILWFVYAFLFHLAALLFGGQASFKRFLVTSGYPYLLAACMVFVSILLLENINPLSLGEPEQLLLQDPAFQLAVNFINYSNILCYLIIAVIVHYMYRINYVYAALSVAIPATAIWGIAELVKII